MDWLDFVDLSNVNESMAKRAVPPTATCVYNSTQTATLQPKSNQSKQRKEREKMEKQEDKS